MKLKRKKVGDRSYDLINTATGEVIANASQTGEHGRDNYPWSWHLTGDRTFGRLQAATVRSEESLKACVGYIESEATGYGTYIRSGDVDGYSIKEGDIFRYGMYYYRALADAHGEFNAYVSVNDHRGENTEIIVRHGHTVAVYKFEGK